ncbi:hypothetical protein TSH100_25840 [Azospirillum sp. TSH100]|uniref:hypothetical protein n=1 Tax=Azospirillum sp. TSH100 TaxID=652764 RepID=UPI000D61E9BE|nr:hypothetical protein [Azospirillum sp. TSH100]PWC81904.1 hypothetical protein TSH100_25840 [Azospirillum sp. TSH100]QCG87427.1 hypothetical protein E6C72_06620 [Azospirillum sp. TSH100]
MYRLLACIALILATVTAMDRVLASALGDLLLRSSDRFMTVYRPFEPEAQPAVKPPAKQEEQPSALLVKAALTTEARQAKGPAATVASGPADVLVLGNSRADNHFPVSALQDMTCGRALNLGMGGAPTVLSALLWDDYVERHGAPRLLVLEPTGVVDNPHDLADLPLLAYYSPRIDAFVRQENHELWMANHAFNLMTFNNNQTMRLVAGLLKPAGDRTLVGAIPDPLKAQLAAAHEEMMTADDANWQALEHIVRSAQAQGTRVAVVITPYFPTYAGKLKNFDAFFAELKARLPAGATVIDARRAVDKDELFMDALHVNEDGVRAMFAALEADLRPLGNCPVDAMASLTGAGNTTH